MEIATRMQLLGTETAFRVSAEANQVRESGRKIYPFHLGDINLATPAHIRQAAVAALAAGHTGYCPGEGILPLRVAIADNVAADRGLELSPAQVSVQPGGKPTIGKFIQVAMERGDEVLYPNPGYPIYESQILYHGGIARPYRYLEQRDGFVLDLDYLRAQISPKTSCLIYNNYQNPLGASSSVAEMEAVAQIALEHDLCVLSDEAYFEILYQGKGRSIASLPGMAARTVILYTFSKKFAMTGWRLGACIGPAELIGHVNRLNTNDESCTNHFVQHAGLAALQGPQDEAVLIRDTLRRRRDVCVQALQRIPGLKCHTPEATFYLFVNVTEIMKRLELDTVESFRQQVLHATGVSFCSRGHFGSAQADETEHYIRFAYSGIDEAEIVEGLEIMRAYLAG